MEGTLHWGFESDCCANQVIIDNNNNTYCNGCEEHCEFLEV
jgi:hypothetical protein